MAYPEDNFTIFAKRIRLNNITNEADQLTEEIAAFERNCNHNWNVHMDPFIGREPIVGTERIDEDRTQGSDVVMTCDYRDVQKMRWQRICGLCGKVEKTEKLKATLDEPDFD